MHLRGALREVEVIVASLKRRYTGITSTISALVPEQTKRLKIAVLGYKLPPHWPQITWSDLLSQGFDPPAGMHAATLTRSQVSFCVPYCACHSS
jgi:hypothetical protein